MVTMVLSRVVSEIFNVENILTLKFGSGHPRSLKVVPFNRLPMVSY